MIVIDELGFVPFSQQGAQLLFGFLSQRCRRASLLITTNLPFSEWTQVFQDPRLLGALLDRLTHTCHILEFAGESYRFRQSQAKHARSRATAESPPLGPAQGFDVSSAERLTSRHPAAYSLPATATADGQETLFARLAFPSIARQPACQPVR